MPADRNVYQFPFKNRRFYSEGLVVEFSVGSNTWVGNFQKSPNRVDFSAIFSIPFKNNVCVIAGGVAYDVDLYEPGNFSVLFNSEVIDAFPIQEIELMIFVPFTDLVCIDSTGIRWETENLSRDLISVIKFSAELIAVETMDIYTGERKIVTIETLTGKLIE
ncbi:MAG: hypothetical protein OEZ02_12500 [Anaerolineae bacterium]|nr:hypothetical protein [Anaerolineae bacterium]